jgi:hypothetical protein
MQLCRRPHPFCVTERGTTRRHLYTTTLVHLYSLHSSRADHEDAHRECECEDDRRDEVLHEDGRTHRLLVAACELGHDQQVVGRRRGSDSDRCEVEDFVAWVRQIDDPINAWVQMAGQV